MTFVSKYGRVMDDMDDKKNLGEVRNWFGDLKI